MAQNEDILQKTTNGRPFFSRRVAAFFFCVIISGMFWLLHQLSREYSLYLKIPVTYINITDKNLVAVDLPDSLEAEVIGSGFTILANRWTHVLNPLELDVHQARSLGKGNFALATNAHPERIEGELGHGFKILRIMPDSIILSFSGKMEKRIPVRPRVTVQTAPEFRVGDSAQTVPSYVVVSGAQVLLDKLNYIETETKVYNELDHSVKEDVRLVLPPDFEQVTINPGEVQLEINVARYTEVKVQVPVEQINVPSNVTWRTFPDKVNVHFLVPVESSQNIKPEMFRVVADFNKANTSTGMVTLEVVKQPVIVRNVITDPPTSEFIIRR